jgi:hypothetical protein
MSVCPDEAARHVWIACARACDRADYPRGSVAGDRGPGGGPAFMGPISPLNSRLGYEAIFGDGTIRSRAAAFTDPAVPPSSLRWR